MKHQPGKVVAQILKFFRQAWRRLKQQPPFKSLAKRGKAFRNKLGQTAIYQKWQAFRQIHPRWAAFAKWSTILLFLLFFSFFSLYFALLHGYFGHIPSYSELRSLRTNQASEVYSADGLLLGRFYREQRVNASLEELPDFVRHALIATEDARFFEHKGIDYKAIMRVFVKTLLLQQEQSGGGSTLSQQLAKNLYPRKSFRFFSLPINKLREMLIAHRLEATYSKEELLRMYLNTVPFGEGIYGIKLAANRFFDKDPAQLNIEEAAVLIGMLKANTTYNPILHPEKARKRRNVVMSQMSKYGYLGESQKDSLCRLPLKTNYTGHRRGLAAHFREQVRRQAEEILENEYKQNGHPYDLYTDGLKIYTSIDSRLQNYAEQAVKTQLATLQKRFNKRWKPSKKLLNQAIRQSERYRNMKAAGKTDKEIQKAFRQKIPMQIYDPLSGKAQKVQMSPRDSLIRYMSILHSGFIALQPQTGAILAYVGDANYEHFQYDYVQARRQVGSIFKPIVYLAAMQAGLNPCEYRLAEQKTYEAFEGWTPENAPSQYGKWYTFRGALMHSVNTISVEICLETGVEQVVELAYQLGVESDLPKGPALALGAADLSLMEMSIVYGSLANRGRKPEPFFIQRIENAEGRTIYEYRIPVREELFIATTPSDALIITDLLRSVVDGGTAASLRNTYGIRGDWAGKTGTSQNQADGWFMAYSPALVVGAWVGANSPRVHWPSLYSGQGARTALPVVGHFLKKYQRDKRYRKWQNKKFPPLSEQQRLFLDCEPSVLDSLQYDDIFRGGDFNEWIKRVTDPEYRRQHKEELRQRREERRKKRKDFFKGLFKD